MNEQRIFVQTSLGEAELGKVEGALTTDEKRLILMLDGVINVADLKKQAPALIQHKIDALLGRLLLGEFIADIRLINAMLPLGEATGKYHTQRPPSARQALHLDMLLLAEVEVEHRIELEHELAQAKTQLANAQADFQFMADKYDRIKTRVLSYKKTVEAKIAEQQAQINLIAVGNQGEHSQRIKLEKDLLKLHSDLGMMQEVVGKRTAELDETLRRRLVAARAADLEKRKKIKVQAEERVRTHPQYNRIRSLEFFKKFRNSDLAELLSWAQWVTVKEGETVMAESDEGLSFYIVVSGRLVAMKGKHVLTVLRTGESFGEMSYLDDESVQRGASVIARTDCELLMIDPMFLESAELMLRMEVAEALVRVQAMRLRRAMTAVVRVLDETGRSSESLYEEIK